MNDAFEAQNTPEEKVPQLQIKNLVLYSLLGLSLLSAGAYWVFGNPFHLQDASAEQEDLKLQAVELQTNHLKLDLPDAGQEGKALEFKLQIQNLPPQFKLADPRLTLQFDELNYQGEPYTFKQTWKLGRNLQTRKIVFQSPGKKTLQFKDAQGKILHEKTVRIAPFPASIFPKDWESHQALAKDPQRFHLWANLYFDAKEAPNQRQYVQVTYDHEIIDRFLVSSGASGNHTPQGEFKLGFKEFYPRSAKYGDTPMPFWSAINMNGNEGEYGFHSLEGGEYLYLLGKPASHGCLRLSRKPSVETHPETGKKYWGDRGGARWIFDRVPKGTPVNIFSKKLPEFVFQDYQAYLQEEAKQYTKKLSESNAG